jgi:hypothetical protein
MLFHLLAAILNNLPQQPPTIWNDPNALALIGIGAGILGAIATIGATIYTVRQGRTKRKIEYQVISDAPIVTVDSTVSGKVQILFNGQPAEKTRVLVLGVRNTGNSSIHKEDYFEPLSFEFDTEVISADILATEPSTLLKPHEKKNFLVLEKQSVQFPLFPLNRRDALTVTVLLKDESAVRANGRLDQGTITKLSPSKEWLLLVLPALPASVAGVSILILLFGAGSIALVGAFIAGAAVGLTIGLALKVIIVARRR